MRPLMAVLLAGRIRPSAFGDALDIPVVCLPVGPRGAVLDAWVRELSRFPRLEGVRVVVNSPAQVNAVRAIISATSMAALQTATLEVIAEPAAWRGAAGLVRDITSHLRDDMDILICEAKRLPPENLPAIINATDASVRNVVGVCGGDEPAGAYVFSLQAIRTVPPIGYFDLKEQLIPSLRQSGVPIAAARVGQAVRRIHDLDSYLECVRLSLERSGQSPHRVSSQAFLAGSAVLSGHCIIEDGAVIEERAVIHDSVVLWGATIGPGAVLNRCVVGSSAIVPARSHLARSTVAAADRLTETQPSVDLLFSR